MNKLEIHVQHIAHGWCGIAMQINDKSIECEAGYLGPHPLNSLIDMCLNLYVAKSEGKQHTDDVPTATWEEEPDTLNIDMHMDEADMVTFDIAKRDDNGRVLQEWHETVPFEMLRENVVAEGFRVLNTFGLYGYRASWMGQTEFPLAQLLRLTGKLHLHRDDDSCRTALAEELQCMASYTDTPHDKDDDLGMPY